MNGRMEIAMKRNVVFRFMAISFVKKYCSYDLGGVMPYFLNLRYRVVREIPSSLLGCTDKLQIAMYNVAT